MVDAHGARCQVGDDAMAAAADFAPITPALLAWQAYEPAVKCDLSSCALDTPEGLVLVDPIPLADAALARLLHGRRLRAILLTNGNHARAAADFRARLGVPVFAPADADGLEFSPDATLTDGGTAPGGLRVISLPGAGPGEIALVGAGVACIGDALIHLPPEGLRLLPAKYCSDGALLRISLRKLLSCDFQIMTFAHGAPLPDAPREKLAQLLS